MATNGKGTGMVGYNVQAVVDAQHHLIVAHEVTNQGHDRSQLANMTRQAKTATGCEDLRVLADRGYFSGGRNPGLRAGGRDTLRTQAADLRGEGAEGRFGKADFVYLPDEDAYRCPAGQTLPWHMTTVEHGMTLHRYWDRASCGDCAIKGRLYDEQGAADHPLGARGDYRRHAAAARPRAPSHAHSPPDRGARVRNAQGLDGRDPLQDQTAEERRCRDELAGAGL